MIVPPSRGEVPPEPERLYPTGVRFLAEGLALERMSVAGYDAVIERVAELSRRLAERGAEVISLMGTSLSFYRGRDFNEVLKRTITDASGLRSTTMSDSVVEALMILGARRLAVGTAYTAPVNERLASYLKGCAFEIASLEALDLEAVEDVLGTGDDELLALGEAAYGAAPDAEALFISCGGLQTLTVTVPLEARCGIPVVSSAMAGAWGAMRLAGLDATSEGHGRLFAAETNTPAATLG